MIKDQCNNCRKNGASCSQNIIFDGTNCDQYVKKLDLSKQQDNSIHSPSDIKIEVDNTQTTNEQCNAVQEQSSFFSSLFSFKGRIRRTRYWMTNICVSLLFIPSNMEGDTMSEGVAIFTLLILIPSIWIMLATCVKRLHDLGKSGWMALLSLIPIVNFIIGIYMAFFKGEECDNQYGPDPY